MQIRKLAALAGSAIMTLAGATMPALAASVSQVNKISDLVSVTDSITSFPLFVVGENAKTADVAGAINVAVYLAGKSTVEKTVTTTGAGAVSGVERQIAFGSSIYTEFGNVSYITIPALKQQDINYYGNKTTLSERLIIPATDGSSVNNARDAVSGQSNGTVVATGLGGLEYRLTSQQSANFATISKTKPLPVKFLGKSLLITSIGTNSISILQGTSATVDATRDLTIGDYTIKFVMGSASNSFLTVLKNGTKIGEKAINEGEWDEFDDGNLKVYVQDAREYAVYGVAQADIIAAVGTDVEKTISSGTQYKTNDQSWTWQISFATANQWGTSDYLGLKFSGNKPDGNTFFLEPGESLTTPEDYVSLIYSGFTVDKYATITVEPATGLAIYNSTASTGAEVIIPSEQISGIKISSDQPILSYVGVEGATDQKQLWVFVNKTLPDNGIVAYYDAKTGRYLNATPYTNTSASVLPIRILYDQTTDYIYYNSSYGLFSDLTGPGVWTAPFKYNSTDLQFVLGTKGTAEAGDLTFNNTGSSDLVGTLEHNVVDKYGLTAISVKSNTGVDKIVIKYPAEQVKAKFGIGKASGTATAAGEVKYKEAIPITTNVVKLDSEVLNADKTGSDMVLLGGPCVNSLVTELATANKFDYSCSNWPAQNVGIIKVVKDAFASGKSVLIIAGTRAADTSLAALVVQNEAKLANITTDKATVTGTSLSDVVVS